MLVVQPVRSVKHALKTLKIDCHQWLSDSSKVHQIRPGPRWGAHDAPPDPLVGWGRGYPFPIPHPLDAFCVSVSSPSASQSRCYGDSISRLWRSVVDPPAVLDKTHSIRSILSKTCRFRHSLQHVFDKFPTSFQQVGNMFPTKAKSLRQKMLETCRKRDRSISTC